MTPYEEQRKKILENTNANMFARDSYSSQVTPIGKSPTYRGFNDPRAFNPDLDTPEGLYKLANQVGLGDKAERLVQQSGGESQKFLSGGLLMDAMDILNVGSYGIVGMLKGVGFKEGVKNRESFSDEDSLGKYGWQGKVAGFILDVAADPFTYVAPWKVVTKVPGVVKGLDRSKNALFGELKTIEIGGQKMFHREGGYSLTKLIPEKLVYGFAVDRTYLDGMQKIVMSNEAKAGDVEDLVGALAKTDTDLMKTTIDVAEDGRLMSKSRQQLQRELPNAEYEKIKELYDVRDNLMERLEELGVISKATKDEHWGSYLKQTYDEFLRAKTKVDGSGGIGVSSRRRVDDLTPEKMKELGQVQDPGVVWGTTLLKQIDLVKKAELQKFVADSYSITKDQVQDYVNKGGKLSDLHQIPDSPAYKRLGEEANLTKTLGELSKTMKRVKKQRSAAIKDDKQLASTIKNIEDEISRLSKVSADELGKGISGLKKMLKDGGLSEGPRKKVATSAGQKQLAESLSKWLNRGSKTERLTRESVSSKDLLKEFLQTDESIALEKAFEDPRMMYQWESMSEFFDAIRYPDKAKVFTEAGEAVSELSEAAQDAAIKRAEASQKKLGKLEQELDTLSTTNKKLVSDLVNKLEDEYADVLFEKRQVLDRLSDVRMGQLAGRVVPKELWSTLKQTFEPTREVGESLVIPFKHAKVIWNPASHARNAVSATIQNWWKLGIGPWRVDLYYDAVREFKLDKQGKSKVLKDMKELGFNERSGQISELVDNYLSGPHIKKSLLRQYGNDSKILQSLKHADKVMVRSYGHMDNVAKVAAYKYGIKNGLSKEDALKKAYEATFNYSEVTPFVHSMRRAIWGVPFITFSLKAAPLVTSTLKNAPTRISVFGKARNDLFKAAGIEGEQEAEAMPDYMRDDMFVMRLPWKDGEGRSMYFDLSYILPFGAIMDGSYLKNPVGANPVIQTIKELSKNETFSGSKVFNESDDIEQVTMDIFTHVGKLYLPPAVAQQFPDGYDDAGNRRFTGFSKFAVGDTQDKGPNERTFYQELLRNMGATVSPYDLKSRERQLAYKQKENLTKLLVENDVMKEFRSPYLPKDSELRPENNNLYDSKTRDFSR